MVHIDKAIEDIVISLAKFKCIFRKIRPGTPVSKTGNVGIDSKKDAFSRKEAKRDTFTIT